VGSPRVADPLAVVERFDAAFGAHDVEAVLACMTEDCLFESTSPPDGGRYVGRAAVGAAFADFFAASPDARFTAEDRFAAGDHVVVLWRYDWTGDSPGHIRGVDVFLIRGDLVAEKRSYVKG
jgi:ketosteroid isomerase-like protein